MQIWGTHLKSSSFLQQIAIAKLSDNMRRQIGSSTNSQTNIYVSWAVSAVIGVGRLFTLGSADSSLSVFL